MSENKRKRNEDHYHSHYKPANQIESYNPSNSILQQPIIVNPVMMQGDEFSEVQQVQLLNGNLPSNQNAQSNLVYIILPSGVNQTQNLLQGVQTLLLVPKDEQGSPSEDPPQLHYYMPLDEKSDQKTKSQDEDDVVFIKDVKVLKSEEDPQYFQNSQNDPLQIQSVQDGNNIDYTLVPQYEETQLPSRESVFVLNSTDLQKAQVENTVDSLKFKMQFKCDYPGCILTFPSVYEKKIHADTHIFPSSTEFKCTICNMMFGRAVDRNKHVDSHAIVNTYKCKMCNKAFPYYTTLVKHINEEKCSSSKSYSCHYCGVQFVDADDLEKHQKENMKYCVCRAKICSEQAFELHTTLCTVFKQKMGRSKVLKRIKKSQNSNDVIVLD